MLARVTLRILGPIILAVVSVAAVRAAPTPGPLPASPAKAPVQIDCATPSIADLASALPTMLSKARTISVQGQAIADGADGSIVFSGPVLPPGDTTEPQFRLFVAPTTFHWNVLNTKFSERHPTDAIHSAPGEPKDSYELHFVAPDFSDTPPYWPRQEQSIVVIACDGHGVVAWGSEHLTFAPQTAAKVWAAAFALLVYLATATIVYVRRRQEVDEDQAPEKLYRIARVEKWSFLKCLDPVCMTADVFDRGSLSKFQILFFVLVVSYGLAYLAIWKGELTDLSKSIVLLLGIPAFGTLGAQFANTSRDRIGTENWAWLVTRRVLPINDPGSGDGPRWSDLVMSDTELDLTKLQALTFSLIVAISMWASGPSGFAKFEVPDGLLGILGLSQVIFVGGRFAKPTTLGDIDDLITELRSRETALRRAAISGVDVDDAGKPLGPPPASSPADPPKDVDAAAKIVPTAAQRFRDTALEVQVLLEAMSHRAVDTERLINPTLT